MNTKSWVTRQEDAGLATLSKGEGNKGSTVGGIAPTMALHVTMTMKTWILSCWV